jgi:glutathione S-transferase
LTVWPVITIIGSYVSPYVRKVLACLALKQLDYRIDPIAPFYGDDEFARLSPLRRVPVLIDDRVTLCDSTVIVQYLEDRYPDRYALHPPDVVDRARARWLEEYADTRVADVIVWGVFHKAVLEPGLWGKPRDLEAIARVMREDLPGVLDYLEGQVPAGGFLSTAHGSASPTSRSPRRSAISASRASASASSAGLAPPRSSTGCSHSRHCRACSRSRTARSVRRLLSNAPCSPRWVRH